MHDGLSPYVAPRADAQDVEARLAAETMVVDLGAYEGPLDVLLALSRTQKVDLRQISILALAEQYLVFVEEAKRLRLELAADYLVMAAWLAFLKSKLLLPPEPEEEGPSGEDMAAHLAFQLERLEAMRTAAGRLMGRDRLGRHFFARGMTETITQNRKVTYKATLLELMQAYARVKTRADYEPLHVNRGEIYTMEQALERLQHIIGDFVEWEVLAAYLPPGFRETAAGRRTATASTFAASLELAKRGRVELWQDDYDAPLKMRVKATP